jgi:ligand-binding sensor domain-containing protein
MKIIFVFLAIFLSVLKTRAQEQYQISRLDNTNGLSTNIITSVFQDSDKLLWLNTWDGLYVYNGVSFSTFKSDQLPSNSHLPNNVITKVREDKSHGIWICTKEGVTKYNKVDGSMSHYFIIKKLGPLKVKALTIYFRLVIRAM